MARFNTSYAALDECNTTIDINRCQPKVTKTSNSGDCGPFSPDIDYLVTYSPEPMDKYIKLFLDGCAKHLYKSKNDKIWQSLFELQSTPVTVIFGVTEGGTVAKVSVNFFNFKTGYTTHFSFDTDDNSFGLFLLHLYDEEKILEAVILKITLTNPIKEKHTTPNKEDNKTMAGFNFDFGVCDNTIRMSAYGLAVKNASGNWVSFDKENMCIMDVEVFNFAAEGFFFKIPIGLSQVQVGDVLVHTGKPVFVTAINADAHTLTVVDPVAGDIKDILPTKSPFGFSFITKIVSLFDGMNTGKMAPSAENPFGGMGMYMIMSSVLNKDSDTKTADKMKAMLPFMLMSNMNEGTNNANFMNNPMMLALMLK